MKRKLIIIILLLASYTGRLTAQSAATSRQILIDVAHGQKFWNDPADMAGVDANFIERVKYMTDQITKSARSVNAGIGYVKSKVNPEQLAECDLLFIHIPSAKYDATEVAAIRQFLQNGGSLFMVMDVDYWSTLEQTNVNDIVSPFGIRFGTDSPDTLSGGYTKAGPVTPKPLKITYHGGRIVTGGTPFCYTNQTEAASFGKCIQLPGGGKIIAMGDGMVSLYMTSWKDVADYQCAEFMHDAFAWLLK
jgi:hypothetical protein